ncbi:MAG: hypothetical protein JXA82_04810 [Sedimentisphaerales bacterium]|nr:hypothetical protein [Sedimentisphaerales bacterium]
MDKIPAHRLETIRLLEKYQRGEVKPRQLLGKFPQYEDDELMAAVINLFCEPLSDSTKTGSWDPVIATAIMAIEQGWSEEQMHDHLE